MPRIKDFCRTDVSTVEPDSTITDVAKLMSERRVGTVVVVTQGRPVGIITHRDLTRRVLARELDPRTTLAEAVMSKGLTTAHAGDSIEAACGLLSRKGVRRLPVLDDEERLVGIVSLNDIVIVLGQQMTNLAMAVAGSEQGEREV